jgi:hypothetical protein
LDADSLFVRLLLPTSFPLGRQSIKQRRQHVISEMPFKIFYGSKMFLAGRIPGLNDLVFRAHERIQIVALYFFSNGL